MNDSTYILCLNISHNSSAALMKDGEILFAAQEERFEQIKNLVGYPKHSIEYCLEQEGIKGKDLSYIAYTSTALPGMEVKPKRHINFDVEDWHDYYGDKFFKPLKGKSRGDQSIVLNYKKFLRDDPKFNKIVEHFDFSYLQDDKYLEDTELDKNHFLTVQKEHLKNHLQLSDIDIHFLDHHTCHAYYAYFGSPFRNDPCIILTLDAWGDGRNQTVWRVENNEPHFLVDSSQNDLGRLYKMATLFLAMKPDEHEFKVMGLSPYAKKEYVEKAKSIIERISKVEGMKIINLERPDDLYSFLKKGWRSIRFDNIAGAVQSYTEEICKQLIQNIVKETGISNIVFSGGIAMNIKLNKVIAEMPEVKSLYVCASGGDESLSLGGCYYLNNKFSPTLKNKPLNTMCLGYDVSTESERKVSSIKKGNYQVKKGIDSHAVAKLLEQGDIVGLIRGRAEFGARALGNRSIIAHPSLFESVQRLNEAIKNRDFWMPFALSILEEYSNDFIVNPKGIQSPFMTIGFDTVPKNYEKIKAGTHPYDKSVRPQIVSKKYFPEWHNLITSFYKITGVPALLNTSLNLHGMPIANNIDDALKTFNLSDLDHLYIQDNFLISKKEF